MNATDYFQHVEDAVDDPNELARLETAIDGDPEVEAGDRDMLLGRIGQYAGQTAKASYDEGELVGEESDAEVG